MNLHILVRRRATCHNERISLVPKERKLPHAKQTLEKLTSSDTKEALNATKVPYNLANKVNKTKPPREHKGMLMGGEIYVNSQPISCSASTLTESDAPGVRVHVL